MKRFFALSAVLAGLVALSCEQPSEVVDRGLQLVWISPPPETLLEGVPASSAVELRDRNGQLAADFDGASVDLHFRFERDSQPGTSCADSCRTTVAQGRASINVQWLAAGAWVARACVRPANPADSLCTERPVVVSPVQAVLVTYPLGTVGRRVRFPVEARLRLPDGTPVTNLERTVRVRFTSSMAEPAGGRVRCPDAGPACERAAPAGVARWDSVLVTDTITTTILACALAPNGHERCDPAGGRQFGVTVPQATLHFVTQPHGGSVGLAFGSQPAIEALEPDSTRRSDFAEPIQVTLATGNHPPKVLAGTGLDGAVTEGTVGAQAVSGLATFTDLRVNLAGVYRLVASTAEATPDTSVSFSVELDVARLLVAKHAGDDQWALVGTILPISPAVLVTGPLGDPAAGIVVTFAVTQGGGSVSDPVQVTDADGRARPGGWTLGSSVGANELTATVDGVGSVHFVATATSDAVVPTQLAFVTEPSVTTVGETIQPAVVVDLQDAQGQRLFGATGEVAVNAYPCFESQGGGCLTSDVELGNAFLGTRTHLAVAGRATFDDLSVTRRGSVTLVASSTGGLSDRTTFYVSEGAPANVVTIRGDGQSATVGTATPLLPTVRVDDAYGNSIMVAPQSVTFTVAMGGGAVTGSTKLTNASGEASPDSWTLGPVPGTNMLTATVEGLAPATFFATGTAPTFDASVVSAGWDFTCATAQTTNLPYCWGDNAYSQLGEGTQTARSRPTLLAGGLLQLTQVTGGFRFACGLASTGAAYCWGNNFYGQLGIDTADVVQHATPEAVVGGHTFTQITTGFGHVCALDTEGAAWCWGATSEGSLGGGTGSPFQPLRVASLLHFTQIDVGGNTSCALTESGDIWCWGNNDYGHLGNNSTDARSSVPVQVAGGRTYTQISVGNFHSCGISLGAVYCWGRNVEAQLGIGFTSPTSSPGSAVPVAALGALGVTRQVSAGNTHTCAVNGEGETYCWGSNANGQLGDFTTTLRTSGVLVRTDARFVAISAGLLHTCALKENGATFCWGSNGSGRLGVGNAVASNYTVPVPVVVP